MDLLSRGAGLLFSDPSANHARQAFANKPRACTDKVTTIADAVRRLVNDGDYLAIGGFGGAPLPPAPVHEILRQGKQNLRLPRHTPTPAFQLLCAGNPTRPARPV